MFRVWEVSVLIVALNMALQSEQGAPVPWDTDGR
jgi:hypothetical protein